MLHLMRHLHPQVYLSPSNRLDVIRQIVSPPLAKGVNEMNNRQQLQVKIRLLVNQHKQWYHMFTVDV